MKNFTGGRDTPDAGTRDAVIGVFRPALVAVVVAATATLPASVVRAQSAPRVIEVTAERFEFWPSEISMTEGEAVALHVSSDDTQHGFRIVGAGTNVTVPKRGKGIARVPLTGLRPKRYT